MTWKLQRLIQRLLRIDSPYELEETPTQPMKNSKMTSRMGLKASSQEVVRLHYHWKYLQTHLQSLGSPNLVVQEFLHCCMVEVKHLPSCRHALAAQEGLDFE